MNKLIIFLLSFLCIFTFSTSKVEALANNDKTYNVNYKDESLGTITSTKDFRIVITYKYKLSNIIINVYKKGLSDDLVYNFEPAQDYIDDYGSKDIVINLCENFTFEEDSDYMINASADFKTKDNRTSHAFVFNSLTYTIENSSPDKKDDEYTEKILTGTEKTMMVIRNYVIPIMYAILGIVLVVKSILLAMDLVKYADVEQVRREKIKGYIYVGVGIFAMLIVNTVCGFYVGLFG